MTTKYGFIYITTNNVNGRKYIGKRTYQKAGWQRYLGSGRLLIKAIRKYGRRAFSREIIYESFCNDDLNKAERMIISTLGAVDSTEFYNLSPGGSGTSYGFRGKQHTAETREKIRQKALGHPVSEKVRDAVRNNAIKALPYLKKYREVHGYKAGVEHPRSIQITINDTKYNTLIDAQKAGYRFDDIKALMRGEIFRISTERKPRGAAKSVDIDGVIYPSIASAMRVLKKSRREIIALTKSSSTCEAKCLGGPQTSSNA